MKDFNSKIEMEIIRRKPLISYYDKIYDLT